MYQLKVNEQQSIIALHQQGQWANAALASKS